MADQVRAGEVADEAARERLEGAFDGLVHQLAESAAWLRTHPFYAEPADRAAGHAFLVSMLLTRLEEEVLFDPDHPTFRIVDPRIREGGDNPDQRYLISRLRGGEAYRIWGRIGTERRLDLQVYAGDPYVFGSGGRSAGYLAHEALTVAPDGSFEVVASAERPASGDWIENPPDGTRILVRQVYGEWVDHGMGECTSTGSATRATPGPSSPRTRWPTASSGPPPGSPPTWRCGRRSSGSSTSRASRPIRSPCRSTPVRSAGSRAASCAMPSGTSPPVRPSWSPPGPWTATTRASSSPTCGGRRSSTPTARPASPATRPCSDRTAPSPSSSPAPTPGVASWLDTTGRPRGIVMLRFDGMRGPFAEDRRPVARVVRLDELDAALPEGTARVTAEERRRHLAERRRHVQVRFGT